MFCLCDLSNSNACSNRFNLSVNMRCAKLNLAFILKEWTRLCWLYLSMYMYWCRHTISQQCHPRIHQQQAQLDQLVPNWPQSPRKGNIRNKSTYCWSPMTSMLMKHRTNSYVYMYMIAMHVKSLTTHFISCTLSFVSNNSYLHLSRSTNTFTGTMATLASPPLSSSAPSSWPPWPAELPLRRTW